MKTRMLVLILILVLIVCSAVLAGSGKKEEELYGTWVNTDYNTSAKKAKYVFKPESIRDEADGMYTLYVRDYDENPYESVSFRIEDKWTDDEGNIWYKIEPFAVFIYYGLYKMSDSGQTLEMIFSNQDYPTEMNLNDIEYFIYYRQE
jgi:hypothetical protein